MLDAARSLGHDVTIIAIKEEASKEIDEAAARSPQATVHWVSIGQLGSFLKILQDAGLTTAVMAGQVKRVEFFGGFTPDLTALSLSRLKSMNTDALIKAVADLMRERGVELVDSTSYLAPLLAGAGQLSDRAPSENERKGPRLRLPHGRCDRGARRLGQTVAIKHQAVVAVEAMEGTDETIARAGHLAGDGVTIVAQSRTRTCVSMSRLSAWRRFRRCAWPVRACCRSMPAAR